MRKLTRLLSTALVVSAAILVLSGSTIGGPLAQGSDESAPVLLAGTVASKITYQGRLTDSGGNPLTGNYNLVFQLWDAASGGSQVGSNIAVNNVSVSDGLFTVNLAVPQDAFDGQALWLCIKVGAEWLSPRHALLAVPYALGLVPGANVEGAVSSDPVLSVKNTGGGYGLRGIASGSSRIGVYGTGPDTTSVRNYGGYFTAGGTEGRAVYGAAYKTGNVTNYGGYFKASGANGRGVFGEAHGITGIGVKGLASGENGQAVRGETAGRYGIGGAFEAYATTGTGVWAKGAKYAGDFHGKLIIRSFSSGGIVVEIGQGLDYAEGFDVSNESHIAPGCVLIIDPDNPGSLVLSSEPYDTKVAGIVAGANDLGSGIRLGSDQFDCDVALAGRVYCNVDATEAGVEPGDLLTTSSRPGYAMKATDHSRAQGAILGKAMEGLAQGEVGQILVLVALQ